MTIPMILRFFIECAAAALVCYAIYREKDLIKLERKAFKYVKAFFKAAYFTLKDKLNKKPVHENVAPIGNSEFEEMLNSLNKHSNIVDIQIAS